MPSAESGAGLRYPSGWALLQARLLAPICGPTMRGSSTHITCSRLETISLYVPYRLCFLFPAEQLVQNCCLKLSACLLEEFIDYLSAFFQVAQFISINHRWWLELFLYQLNTHNVMIFDSIRIWERLYFILYLSLTLSQFGPENVVETAAAKQCQVWRSGLLLGQGNIL